MAATSNYREPDREAFLRRNQEAQSRSSGDFQDYFKYEVGPAGTPRRYRLRIMPPHVKMEDPFVETKMHFLPSKELKNGRPIPIGIVCLGVFAEACPACKHVDGLYQSAKSQDDVEAAERLKREAKDKAAKLRVFTQIVDMEHPDKGVQRFAFGPDIEKKLRMCFFDDDGEYRNITHPKTGRDVLFFAAKKAGTDYNTYEGTRATEAEAKLPDMDWLDKIEDLNALVVKPSVADMELALKGIRPPQAQVARPGKTDETPAAETKRPLKGDQAERPSRRQAVVDDDEPVDPYAAARKAIAAATKEFKLKFEPMETTPDAVEKLKKLPPCYTKSTEVTDEMCQTCRVLLPCATVVLARGEIIAGNKDE